MVLVSFLKETLFACVFIWKLVCMLLRCKAVGLYIGLCRSSLYIPWL
jgi:hypothetical protein